MAQVDEFLDVLTADYTVLYKENAVLKSKMKVLVDKIEEYRATEDAMRMTLLSAQKMANAMVAEAEEKKNAALRDAEADAQRRIGEIRQEVENEAARLTAAKKSTADYLNQLRSLFEHEQDYLGSLSELTAPAPPPPDQVAVAATEIKDSVHKIISDEFPPDADPEDTKDLSKDEPPDAEAPAVAAAAAGESIFQIIDLSIGEKSEKKEEPSGRRIDFNSLQFGKDYEIK